MSSNQYYTVCPVCENDELSVNEENRPFPTTTVYCEICGFYTNISIGRESLEDVLENTKDSMEEGGSTKEEIESKLTFIKEEYNKYSTKDIENGNLF